MRKVLENWMVKKKPQEVENVERIDNDKMTVEDGEKTVESKVVVVDEKVTRKKNKAELSAVQKAKEKFSLLAKDRGDSFEQWKASKSKEKMDRSASNIKNINLFVNSLGEGRSGAVGEGVQGAIQGNFIHLCRGGKPAPSSAVAANSATIWQSQDRREGSLYTDSGCQGKTGFSGRD